MHLPPLVLASSSPYRKARLQSLGIVFATASPGIDEARQEDEPADALVFRLAAEKARALQKRFPAHMIIGSDQVAVLGEQILTKPGSENRARAQLQACAGREARFLTGLCLLDTANDRQYRIVEPYDVLFRRLSDAQIHRYIQAEQPYDCAGSFKMEGLGITLFRQLSGRDPNALVGLPMMAVEDGLQSFGLSLMDYLPDHPS